MKPHKHADVIKAWADGAEIEWFDHTIQQWSLTAFPEWNVGIDYRVKPTKPADTIEYFYVTKREWYAVARTHHNRNLKLTYDGETNELKDAEVI